MQLFYNEYVKSETNKPKQHKHLYRETRETSLPGSNAAFV